MKYRPVPDDLSRFTRIIACRLCRSLDTEFEHRSLLDKMVVPVDNRVPIANDHVTDYGAETHEKVAKRFKIRVHRKAERV